MPSLFTIPPSYRWLRWLVPALLGSVLLVGVTIVIMRNQAEPPPPPPDRPASLGEVCGSGKACGEGLVCATGTQRCMLAPGAGCSSARADLCDSGECNDKTAVCAIALGGPCDRPDDGPAACVNKAACDPVSKTCVANPTSVCKAGTQQCTASGSSINVCGSDGTWKTADCPVTAPQCRDGKCQCSPNKGKPCNCGGIIQCNGTCSTAACSGTCTNGRCCVFSGDPACGTANLPNRRLDFNAYVLRAIDRLYRQYGNQGYAGGTAYTHDLDYASPREIKQGVKAPATMCVAAVSEVIIVALKLYADEQHDPSVFIKLPAQSWVKGAATNIRPYMFLYDTVESSGTADALSHFGIGEHLPFPALVPGDFIGLNRDNRSGHAVVFLGFLNAQGQIEPTYDARKVVGFKYFSSQGKAAPNGGFGYRWAFFGNCPAWREPDKLRDCGIVLSDNQKILNTGYMLHPSQWTAEPALRTLKAKVVQNQTVKLMAKRLGRMPTSLDLQKLSRVQALQLEQQANREIEAELPARSRLVFDGTTTDD